MFMIMKSFFNTYRLVGWSAVLGLSGCIDHYPISHTSSTSYISSVSKGSYYGHDESFLCYEIERLRRDISKWDDQYAAKKKNLPQSQLQEKIRLEDQLRKYKCQQQELRQYHRQQRDLEMKRKRMQEDADTQQAISNSLKTYKEEEERRHEEIPINPQD